MYAAAFETSGDPHISLVHLSLNSIDNLNISNYRVSDQVSNIEGVNFVFHIFLP
jgi:hypothetical protein